MISSINSQTFAYINRFPVRFSYNKISFVYRPIISDSGTCLGFVLPRTLGGSVKRNKFKRRCRNAFNVSANKHSIKSLGLIVKPKDINLSYSEVYSAFDVLLASMGEG